VSQWQNQRPSRRAPRQSCRASIDIPCCDRMTNPSGAPPVIDRTFSEPYCHKDEVLTIACSRPRGRGG
jgi:hypothetical protein